ncbi:MAG: hypothetical protein RI935_353 [Candidatus Parcubacteria bacterium]|jgi:hypothetical protein
MNKKYYIIGLFTCIIAGVSFYLFILPQLRTSSLDEALPVEVNIDNKKEVVSTTSQLVEATESKEEMKASSTSQSVSAQDIAVSPQIARSAIVPTKTHPASGYVRLVSEGDTKYLRYEDFSTINGPDLVVYLAKDLEAKDFVNLGALKATSGNFNYKIPENINIEEYQYALVWCEAFSVLFNSAKL